MAKKWDNIESDHLFKVILELKNLKEAKAFFRDLLTENEIIEFSNRWKAVRMLSKKMPYEQIEKQTGLSSRTIARIQKWRAKGMGGYQKMIKRTSKS